MASGREPRRHLRHEAHELVLRSSHVAAVQAAFRAGKRVGRLDGIAEERERALRIILLAEELNLLRMGRILLGQQIEVTKALGILRVAAGLPPQDPADNAFDDPKLKGAPC